jgi:sucrose-phosphate synthase
VIGVVNRYLFVRWGVDVANVTIFVGETGDTDHEELIPGIHKTIILKDAVKEGSEHLLRSPYTYVKDDVVPSDSPSIVSAHGHGLDPIVESLRKLSTTCK